jgi:GGDEF domain-containing protein
VPEDATRVVAKVLDAVGAPFRLDGHEVSIAASVGVSVYPGDGTSPDELLRSADAAMYRDKHRAARPGPRSSLPRAAFGAGLGDMEPRRLLWGGSPFTGRLSPGGEGTMR